MDQPIGPECCTRLTCHHVTRGSGKGDFDSGANTMDSPPQTCLCELDDCLILSAASFNVTFSATNKAAAYNVRQIWV